MSNKQGSRTAGMRMPANFASRRHLDGRVSTEHKEAAK